MHHALLFIGAARLTIARPPVIWILNADYLRGKENGQMAHAKALAMEHRVLAYRLPVTESVGVPAPDAEGIDEELIRSIVDEFYRRARREERLGPVFETHIDDWDGHLDRMTDFWSAALLRTGRYSGRPVERHRAIEGLNAEHFDRWISLFTDTVRDLCTPARAEAFLWRARRMRDAMTRVLGLAAGVD
jgi:hemoglobin